VGRKQYDLAIADYDKALSVAPTMVIVHYNKAAAFDQQGRVNEAIAGYRVFLEHAGPEHASLAAQTRQRLAALGRQ
jgi:tetratricopeptide (TPR) repeat protein